MQDRAVLETETLGRKATFELGRELGSMCFPGTVVGLTGDLGAGKTVLVKGLALALGVPEYRVVSPTFTLVNEYSGRIPLYHFDLYRMGDESELDSIDYRRYLEDGVCAVEWFERFPNAWPEGSTVVTIEYISPRKRRVNISGGRSLIEGLCTKLGIRARRVQ